MWLDPAAREHPVLDSDDPLCALVVDHAGRVGIWLVERELPSDLSLRGAPCSYGACVSEVLKTFPSWIDAAALEAEMKRVHATFDRACEAPVTSATTARAAPRIACIRGALAALAAEGRSLAEIEAIQVDTALWEAVHRWETGASPRLQLVTRRIDAIPVAAMEDAFGPAEEHDTTSPRSIYLAFGERLSAETDGKRIVTCNVVLSAPEG
jgi:hypothetical protein